MGAATVNLSKVHERISIRATTARAIAGPSNRRAYSLWSRLRRAGVAAFGPAAWACALPGLLAGLTGYRAYREAALASPPPHPGETADCRQSRGIPYPPVSATGNLALQILAVRPGSAQCAELETPRLSTISKRGPRVGHLASCLR